MCVIWVMNLIQNQILIEILILEGCSTIFSSHIAKYPKYFLTLNFYSTFAGWSGGEASGVKYGLIAGGGGLIFNLFNFEKHWWNQCFLTFEREIFVQIRKIFVQIRKIFSTVRRCCSSYLGQDPSWPDRYSWARTELNIL